jgi:hypothetical protein
MRFRNPLVLAVTTVAIVGFTALPAAADPTVTTFSMTGGSLTFSVQGTASLTGEATGVAANVITGTLGAVSVTDARGGTTGWVTSAISTQFTGPSVSTDVRYTNGTVTKTGTNTVAAVTDVTIIGAVAVATATAVSGNNTASWNPTLDVSLPAGALAGAYTGTVTTSIV